LKRGRFIKADTIPKLANKCGHPADTLVDTVNKYIQYHKDGKDPEFNKSITKAVFTLEKGPFYAIPQWPAVHFCMGGLRIASLLRSRQGEHSWLDHSRNECSREVLL
jgi:fumarate reductase flavoprotein subunit